MNSQKYNKEELYPEDFSCDEKLQFDMYLEQAKMLFPKLANDEWLIKRVSLLLCVKKNPVPLTLRRKKN